MEYQFTVNMKGKVTLSAYSQDDAFDKAQRLLKDAVLGRKQSRFGTVEVYTESLRDFRVDSVRRENE